MTLTQIPLKNTMNKTTKDKLVVVVCRAGKEPELVTASASFNHLHMAKLAKDADLYLPYPEYLTKEMPSDLVVCCDRYGASKRRPVNRWGVIGDFIVCSMNSGTFCGLNSVDARRVIQHLAEEYGYLKPDIGVCNLFHGRVGLFGAHVLTAEQFIDKEKQTFDPDLVIEGNLNSPVATFINWLTSRCSKSIIAADVVSTPDYFQMAMQFGTTYWDRMRLTEFQELYRFAFTDKGDLKPAILKRPPLAQF